MVQAGSWRARSLQRCYQRSVRTSERHFTRSCPLSNQQPFPISDTSNLRKVRPYKQRVAEKIIFSGIQPTGVPHLGNYLGALRQWKQLQDEKEKSKNPQNQRLLFAIVDLHALTHNQNPAELLKNRLETLASLLAIGLNSKHSRIFYQSSIPCHAQLMWYLSNVASAGYLSRMTQWKSKLGVAEDASIDDQAAREKLRLGLFSYPVLQAADILLYGATLVPVGEDQVQHVEFTRTLARSFNSQYKSANNGKDFFKIPEVLVSPAKRIMSLKDPTVKMSKSHADEKSRILITDSPDVIHAKLKASLTDSTEGISYNIEQRPGVSNLVEILKHVSNNNASCQEIATDNANLSMRAFKEHVAEEVIKCLAGFRDRFSELMKPDNDTMKHTLEESHKAANSTALIKLRSLERLIGLSEPRRTSKLIVPSSRENKEKILREQQEEEDRDEEEPDVVPQKDEGVKQPLAS